MSAFFKIKFMSLLLVYIYYKLKLNVIPNILFMFMFITINKFTKLTLDIPRYFLWDLCPA